jgi:hypothetical protein
MATNMTLASRLAGPKYAEYLPLHFSDTGYRSVQLFLGRGLPSALFAWINSVSNYAVSVQAKVEIARSAEEFSDDDRETLKDLLERLRNANELLRRYLQDILKVDLGELPLVGTSTSEEIEQKLRKQLFGD